MPVTRSQKFSCPGQIVNEKLEMDGGAEWGNWDQLSPEVLDMIFQHLQVQDLLSCSVMSKNWKKSARDVLKRKRECYAHIKYFHRDNQALNEMIASTDIMEMINGLHIRNEKRPKDVLEEDAMLWELSHIRCSYVASLLTSEEKVRKLEEAKQSIAAVLSGQWQYLNLDMGSGWRNVLSLDKGKLLREVVSASCESLQKLVIGQDRDWKFIPCCGKSFTKLKVIQAEEEQYMNRCEDDSFSNFAPNLEKIRGAMMTLDAQREDNSFILERMENVRVNLDFRFAKAAIEAPDRLREAYQRVSGLYRLDLQYRCDYEHRLALFRSLVLPFALRSLSTLKEFRIYTLDLYKLSMTSDGLKFPNIQRLSLATRKNVPMAVEILALKNIDVPKVFPNLEQLELTKTNYRHDIHDDMIPVGQPITMDQSDLPMAIDFECRGRDGLYNHELLEFFNTIYPKLNKVRILKLRDVLGYKMSKIFLEVQSLEHLEINVPRQYCQLSLEFGIDALLCGINKEEAQLPWLNYQKKHDKLNSCLVPIRPSLWNARGLKELKISEDRPTVQSVPMVHRSWVTQVTENLPERHVRNMTVTFDGTKVLYDRLNKLRAFTLLRANKIKDE